MGRTPGWLIALIVGTTLFLVASFAPIIPDHGSCRTIYLERMRYAQAPQITAEHAAAIRAWAITNGCKDCGNSGRISFATTLHGSRGCMRF